MILTIAEREGERERRRERRREGRREREKERERGERERDRTGQERRGEERRGEERREMSGRFRELADNGSTASRDRGKALTFASREHHAGRLSADLLIRRSEF